METVYAEDLGFVQEFSGALRGRRSLRDLQLLRADLPMVGINASGDQREHDAKAEHGTKCLELPLEEGGSYGEAGAYAGQENEVPLFQAAVVESGLHGQGDGGGGGVAVTVDIDDDAAFIHAETLGGGEDDALVGLMGDKAGEVFAGDAVAGEDGLGGFGHLADSELVDGPRRPGGRSAAWWRTVSAVAGWREPPAGMLRATAPEPSISW